MTVHICIEPPRRILGEMNILLTLLSLAHVCQGRVFSEVAAQPKNLGRDPEYKRVCYYTNWSQYRKQPARFFPFNIDPFLCTHLIFAFAKVDYNGHLAPYEWNDIQYPHLYKQFTGLKTKNPHLKTLLAVGGWTHGSRPFTDMAKTKVGRQSFIDHAIQYLRTHNFDGLDLDWEYPANRGSPKEDRKRFSELVMELKAAFIDEASRTGKERLLLAAAVAAGVKIAESAYEVTIINKYLDFINVMSYDLHGSWSKTLGINAPLYPDPDNQDPKGGLSVSSFGFQDNIVKDWLRMGATRDKLVVGIAMYGRSFTLCSGSQVNVGDKNCGPGKPAPFTREKGFISYYEVIIILVFVSEDPVTIKDRLKNGWTRVWSSSQMVPYAYSAKEKQWVGYDDIQSVQLKAQYIKQNKLAGAMMWSIDLDDFANIGTKGKVFPLTRAIRAVLEDSEYPSFQPPPKISVNKRLPQPTAKTLVQNDGKNKQLKSNIPRVESKSPFSPPKSPYSPPKGFVKKPISKTYLPRPGASKTKPEVESTPPSRAASSQAGGPVLGTIATPKYNNKSYSTTTSVPRSSTPATSTRYVTKAGTISTGPNKPLTTSTLTKQASISTSTNMNRKDNTKVKATETAAISHKREKTAKESSHDKQYPQSPYTPAKTAKEVKTVLKTMAVTTTTSTNRNAKENAQKTTTSENVISQVNEPVDLKSADKSLTSQEQTELQSNVNDLTLNTDNQKHLSESTMSPLTPEEHLKYPKSPYKPKPVKHKATEGAYKVGVTVGTTTPIIQTTIKATEIKPTETTTTIYSNSEKKSNKTWKSSSYDAKTKGKMLPSMDLKQDFNPKQDETIVKRLNKSPYTKPPYIWNPHMTPSVLKVITPTAQPPKPSQPAYIIATSPYKPISTVNTELVITDSLRQAKNIMTKSFRQGGVKVVTTDSPRQDRVQNVITDLPRQERITVSYQSATSPFKPWKTTVYRKYITPTRAPTRSTRDQVAESIKNEVKEIFNPIVDVYDGHSSNRTQLSDSDIPAKSSTQLPLTQLTTMQVKLPTLRTIQQGIAGRSSTTASSSLKQGASPTDSEIRSTRPFFLFAKNKTFPTQKAIYQSRATRKDSSKTSSTSPSTTKVIATTHAKRTTYPATKRVLTTRRNRVANGSTERSTAKQRVTSRITMVHNEPSKIQTTRIYTMHSTHSPNRLSRPSTIPTRRSTMHSTHSPKRLSRPSTRPTVHSTQSPKKLSRPTRPTTRTTMTAAKSNNRQTTRSSTRQGTKATTITTTERNLGTRSQISHRPIKQPTIVPAKRKTVNPTTRRQTALPTEPSRQTQTQTTKANRTVVNKESHDVVRNTGSPALDSRKMATPKPKPSQRTKTYWIRTRPTGPQRIFAWMTNTHTTVKSTINKSTSQKMDAGIISATTSAKEVTKGVTDTLVDQTKRTHWPMEAILGDDHIHPLKSALFGLDITKKPPSSQMKYHTDSPMAMTTGGWLLDWLHMITSKPTYKPLMKTLIPDVLGPYTGIRNRRQQRNLDMIEYTKGIEITHMTQ
ncbi:proteoglycan 4-like [Gigantopelta aegis]|uniref:proteoglycan 4-like n=1 Tax=Gigantopelta aegis TaxID=1735272 RepID=UPI001B887CCE|nr:proteoglycan 4-like [Gigantopelta aegis]